MEALRRKVKTQADRRVVESAAGISAYAGIARRQAFVHDGRLPHLQAQAAAIGQGHVQYGRALRGRRAVLHGRLRQQAAQAVELQAVQPAGLRPYALLAGGGGGSGGLPECCLGWQQEGGKQAHEQEETIHSS